MARLFRSAGYDRDRFTGRAAQRAGPPYTGTSLSNVRGASDFCA
jgi:hypothetical protein